MSGGKHPKRMPVSSPPARPQRQTGPGGGSGDARHATTAPRSVILVGAGRRGFGAHIPAVEACGPLRLSGIVDTGERIAQLRDISRLAVPMYDNLGTALAAKPDLAIVATPHDSHVPLTKELLRAGVPTLLEKPPARNAPEMATLLRLSRKLETPLATSLPLHYRDCYRPFTQLLRSPSLTDARVTITVGVPSWPGANSWRLSRERAGGGVLIDLGYHYLEMLLACLGPPDTKLVRLAIAADSRYEVEDEAQVCLSFAERRIEAQLQLRSGAAVTRFSELSINQRGVLLHESFPDQEAMAAPKPDEAPGPLPVLPAVAQLEALVMSGFLDGRGDWYQDLRRQHVVMLLLDELYATAEHTGCPPGFAGVSAPAFLADVTELRERTPA